MREVAEGEMGKDACTRLWGEHGFPEQQELGRMGEGCHFQNLTCGLAVYILYDSLSFVLDHGVHCVMTICVIGHDRRAVLGVILAWVLVRRGFEGNRDTRVTSGRLFRVWIVDSLSHLVSSILK